MMDCTQDRFLSKIEKAAHVSSRAADFTALSCESDEKKHLLLCASGSVATIKIPDILKSLSINSKLSIRLIFTRAAAYFLNNYEKERSCLDSLYLFPNVDGIYLDEDEWAKPWTRGNAMLHIGLRRWADIMVIAPLSANTLAKIATGLADNLLTSVVRAWDIDGIIRGTSDRKRIIVAPAMNTAMWKHPITEKQLRTIEYDWGIDKGSQEKDNQICPGWLEVLRPVKKVLACGDLGDGAMREWSEIVKVVEQRLGL